MRRDMSWTSLGLILLVPLCLCHLEKPHVPQYMLDLYQGKTGSLEHYDTVRSYSNVYGVYYSDYGKSISTKNNGVHVLGFNLSHTFRNESVELAELRLYTRIEQNEESGSGVEGQVSIYHVSNNQDSKMIATRHLLEFSNTWESFNVTSAVLEWIKSAPEEHLLEVRIEGSQGGDMDISIAPYEETEPLLVVYSRILHPSAKEEFLNRIKRSLSDHRIEKRSEEDEDEEELTNYISGDPSRAKSKKKKTRTRRNPCRRKPLEVNFDKINYDTWVIAPRSYEAFECTGKCFYPMSDHLTPTRHAIIQTQMHQVYPKTVARACCVPTKLGSISVLYQNTDGSVTYHYEFEDMVVTECGCR